MLERAVSKPITKDRIVECPQLLSQRFYLSRLAILLIWMSHLIFHSSSGLKYPIIPIV